MGAATGAMRCSPSDDNTRCVTGKLEILVEREQGGPNTGGSIYGGEDGGKLVLLKAALEIWTIMTGLFVVIFILSRSKLRTNTTNWLIINAMFVCLLNALFIDPILIDIHQLEGRNEPWRFGSLYCYMLFGGPSDILGAMVPLTLIMIIIDRLRYIRSSDRKEEHLSLGAILTMIVGPWVFMTLITVIMVYVFRAPKFASDTQECTIQMGNTTWVQVSSASWLTLSLGIPLVLMNIAAMIALASVCCTTIKTSADDAVSEKKEKTTVKQASIMIGSLTCLFTLVAVPSAVAYITHYTTSGSAIGFDIIVILQMAFRAAQPVIFVLLAPDIRSSAYEAFCGWKNDKKRRDEQTRLIKVTGSPTRTPE